MSVKEEIFHCGTNQRRILMGKGLSDTSVLVSSLPNKIPSMLRESLQ